MAKFANFLPELWSKEITRQLSTNQVFMDVCNKNITGTIQRNGSVYVYGLSDEVTVGNYDPNAPAIVQQTVKPTANRLDIDQAKYFNIKADKVHMDHTKIGYLNLYALKGAKAIRDIVDLEIYNNYIEVDPLNILGTDGSPIPLTKANLVSNILKLEEKLNILGVPSDRWLSVSAEVATILKEIFFDKSSYQNMLESRPIGFATSFITRIGMFDVFESSRVRPIGSVHNLLGGTYDFISFAGTIDSIMTYSPEGSFEDAIKGLYVFGTKVFEPRFGCLLKATV
jgi:hypothetical protein